MISFLKSKPILRDLITDNYVDIHSHLLPNVDDGATSFQETLLLTQKPSRNWCFTIYHYTAFHGKRLG